jgi:hypothetical protein
LSASAPTPKPASKPAIVKRFSNLIVHSLGSTKHTAIPFFIKLSSEMPKDPRKIVGLMDKKSKTVIPASERESPS